MHLSKNYGIHFGKGLLRDHSRHKAFKASARKFAHLLPVMPGNFSALAAPPENQGSFGLCWDFSITNALRSALMIAGKDPGPLSKMQLCYNCLGTVKEFGIDGGDFDAGQNYLSPLGPCLETDWPYNPEEGTQCQSGLNIAATALHWVLVGDGVNRPTAQQLCEAIYNGGRGAVLSVDVAADNHWSNYYSGIYEDNTSQEINHMVRIYAWNAGNSVDSNGNSAFDDDGSFKVKDGTPYFIVRNNWNTTWGINGDMHSAYEANNLAETAMVFIV